MLVALTLLLQEVVGILSFVGPRQHHQHPSTILQVRHHQCTNWSGADKAWRQSTSLASFKDVYSTTDDHDITTTNIISNRRHFFGSILSSSASVLVSSSLLFPRAASAMEQETSTITTTTSTSAKKPFAPLETLLPAVRVKLSINRAINLTNSLITASKEPQSTTNAKVKNLETIKQQLEQTILPPQNYVQNLKLQGVPPKPADLYLQSYKPTRGDLPLQRYLIQNGDVQTWKQLKKSEKEQESSSEGSASVRAALNAYTDALSFSSASYLLNVDRATQSSMVREDRLPDVKQVITSDMGMRYLYRNQVLTAMDDVKAEFEYQQSALLLVKTRSSSDDDNDNRVVVDWVELLDLLDVAGKAMDRWFSLIDSDDVRDAFEYAASTAISTGENNDVGVQ